jgi:hypothetical protein
MTADYWTTVPPKANQTDVDESSFAIWDTAGEADRSRFVALWRAILSRTVNHQCGVDGE